jgi:membrane protein implicated in regulation of membrane protease activity
MDYWMIWVGIGLICMIIEIFTPGFLFMSFGIGAIITGLFSILNISVPVQIVIFIIVTFVIFLFMRKISKKLMPVNTEETNIFALKQKTGTVVKEILPDSRGYVKVGGEEWSAVSEQNVKIEAGNKVIVSAVEGNKLVVNKVEKEK